MKVDFLFFLQINPVINKKINFFSSNFKFILP